MEVYLCIFVNGEQNNWAQLLPITEFAYNNYKNASIGHTSFKLNCGNHFYVSFKNRCDAYSKSFSTKRLAIELRELINLCCQIFLHAQNLQKQVHDKGIKLRSYTPGKKYIKTKRNWELKAKFFWSFWVLHLDRKQTFKLKLPAK